MTTELSAAIYCRISNDKEGAGLGVDRQEQDCRQLAERLGVPVAEVLTDNDISAYSGKRRPGYERLLELVGSGRITHVLAWHNDRLHRSLLELEHYIAAVEQHNVQTHFATSGEIDLTNPTGRMIARQVGVMARYESEHRAERIARKHRQSAVQGKWRGGIARMFGYQEDGYTLEPTEAKAIQEAYAAILAGRSMGSILREWDERGIRTARGNKFAHVTLKKVLLRERNYGASVYKGEVVGVGEWEPITDEATFRAVKAVLTDPSRKRNWSNQGKHLMSGIMVCGKCGAVMRTMGTRQGGTVKRYYRCSAATHTNIRVEDTDAFITELVLARLSRQDSPVLQQPKSVREPEGEDLEQKAKALRLRLNEWADAFAAGELTRAQHAKGRERIEAELAEVESLMSAEAGGQLLADLITADDVTAMWEGLEWAQKREIVQALMTVTVLPVGKGYVRRFQPERLEIAWK